MADKSFGVKELNLLNASGTPTVTSPNNLNLNANTVAISTSCTIGNNLTVTSTTNSANVNVTGVGTLTRAFATDLSVSGISTISQPSNANPHSLWDVVNNGSSAYRFTGPGQDGAEDNPNIYLVRGQRYIFKVNASGHPFQLRVANGGAAYSDGVTNNGAQSGNVVINVQHDAPAQLYYQCTNHGSMVGNIYIVGGPQVISGVVTATSFSGNLSGGTVSGTTGTFSGNLSVAQNIVHTGDTDTKIEFLTDIICFDTAGSESLRITSAGRLGVNITTPSAQLDVRTDEDPTSGLVGFIRNNTSGGNGVFYGMDLNGVGNWSLGMPDNTDAFTIVDGEGNSGSERLRITSGGYSKHSNDGTYDGYSNAGDAHEFRQSANKPTLWCSNSNSSHTWEIIRAESARSNSSAYHFITCTSGNLSDDEFRVRGDGEVFADGGTINTGADYAEYFEWSDGNSSNEDRRGITVVLDGNKVKISTSSDSTDNIIGVVSGRPSVVGDGAWNKWTDKYLKDDYGAYQRDENGERKQNPSFDDTKTYVPREDRKEWDAIGMVGKLRIRKGQKTGTRWIKMRDISASIEEWLVR